VLNALDVEVSPAMSDPVASGTPEFPEPKSKKTTNTAHLKVVPETRELRDRLRMAARDYVAKLDKSKPLTKEESRTHTEALLKSLNLGEQYSGFGLVCIANEFWREQVAAVPFHRRLMLLPHCLKNAEGCPAEYDEFGLNCEKCGACEVADFKTKAEKLGYKVLVSEGTPIVLKIIVSGHVDAIVGVACLNVLEKAFDKILLSGIPCIATPLLSSNCKSTSVDDDWVFESIDLITEPTPVKTKSYMHLMRASSAMFDEAELERLAPRSRKAGSKVDDPLAVHESIAYDFLSKGGKRSRPLITLATYDALTGGKGTLSADGIDLPDHVKRAALAIESFHKASLVHDDIEDDDAFRYGIPTLHKTYGIGTAINVGDYLVGLGYRLVSRDRKALGAETAADILDKLADAHLKLSEGQGAELLWRDAANKALTPIDALKIYALKTSPAFEAALYSGVRLAGPADKYEKAVADFSRNLGVAFQILNDLKDWSEDGNNKLVAGQDVLAARPTLLLALALEALSPQEKSELLGMISAAREHASPDDTAASETVKRVRALYQKAKVFSKADAMVDKFRAKAESIADEIEPVEFRELMYYLVDTVLEKGEVPAEAPREILVELGLRMTGTPVALGVA
jgi:geranylgeranyl diphosphate synthase, type II